MARLVSSKVVSSQLPTATGDQSYRVPSSTGGFIPADPIKFCLRFRPPTIAIIYQLQSKPRKYVREFVIDLKGGQGDLSKLCDDLFEKELHYFNPQKISKVQVMELLQKLQQQIYPTGANKENAVAQKKPNFLEKKKLLDSLWTLMLR